MPFEESIKVPFIVEYPHLISGGRSTDALLRPVDIMPTLLSLAGLNCPEVDGIDISGAATGVVSDKLDAALLMKLLPGGNPYIANAVTPWRGVRTKRYTYAVLCDKGPWLLYDNQEDSFQLKNRINDPNYASIQSSLDKRMRELLAEAGDTGKTEDVLGLLDAATLAKL